MTAPMSLSPDSSRGHDPSRGLAMLTTALGAEVAAMLEAADTIEVIAKPDGRLWLEQVGKGRIATPHRLEASETERVIRLVATLTGTEVNRDTPIVSAELPPVAGGRGGERFEVVLPPISRDPVDAAIADGVQRSASGLTNLVVDRGLAIPPTIRVGAGTRVTVIVTRRVAGLGTWVRIPPSPPALTPKSLVNRPRP